MRWLIPTLLLIATPASAVPVIPQFTQGQVQTNSTSTQKIVETVTSVDINTGYQYSVTGTGIQQSGDSIAPPTVDLSTTVSGVSSTWVGLQHSDRPNWTVTTPGAPFQFNEVYTAPGVSNVTTIQRTTDVTSTTDSLSIFQQ